MKFEIRLIDRKAWASLADAKGNPLRFTTFNEARSRLEFERAAAERARLDLGEWRVVRLVPRTVATPAVG